MKRFWLVLLSVGLIMAFGTTVFAATDAKFSGQWYLKGWYNKDASLLDKDGGAAPDSTVGNRGSSAFYTTRLRMNIDFPIAKGLDFYTRFDALERKWMGPRTTPIYSTSYYSNTTKEQENIGWEGAYVRFATPIGMFTVGDVVNSGPFGTIMSDYYAGEGPSAATIAWGIPIGKFYFGLSTKKSNDNPVSSYGTTTNGVGVGTSNDSDTYYLTLIYGWDTGSAGFLQSYVNSESSNIGAYPTKAIMPCYTVYAKNKFGKIYFEMETGLATGYYRKYQNGTPAETASVGYNIEGDWAYSTYWNVEADLAPFKVGGRFWFSKGDDPATKDKLEGGFRQILDLDGGVEFMMIMWNKSYIDYFGKIAGAIPASASTNINLGNAQMSYWMQNVWFYQLYGSYAVTPKLKIDSAFCYAYADSKPTGNGGPVSATNAEFVGNQYGKELDVMATYKIYNNLSYMVGAAYMWTGDYFKGTNTNAKIVNNYLITHKLTLTF